MSVTRAQLKEYIGENVEIVFSDNKVETGVLRFADDFSAKHDYRKPNYFYINNLSFKVSHVKKLKVVR